jgi:hypothetical protein
MTQRMNREEERMTHMKNEYDPTDDSRTNERPT